MIDILKNILDGLNLFTICTIPSHDSLSAASGVKSIAKGLCRYGSLDGTSCLIRKETIPARHLAEGGRNFSKEEIGKLKGSLIVENKDLIKEKKVLLLDDISTTGNSLESAKQELLENGAKFVICIVLGKTSFDHNL